MTCTTFVLGGVAAWAPYYIFEREARFQINAESLNKLAEQKATDGTPLVPPAVIDKLRTLAGADILDMPATQEETDHESVDANEREQYQGRIVDAVVASDSRTLGTINTIFGGIIVVSGLVATLFGGWLGDRLRDRVRGSYFLVSGVGALIAFPAFVAMLYVPFPYAWGCVFVTVFFLFVNTGPANTILANVTRHRIRATAFAINILIIHTLGDAISPPLIGLVADLSSLGTALLCVSFFILVAGGLWIAGARSLDEETRRITVGRDSCGRACEPRHSSVRSSSPSRRHWLGRSMKAATTAAPTRPEMPSSPSWTKIASRTLRTINAPAAHPAQRMSWRRRWRRR